MRFRIWGGRDLGTGGQEDVGQGHRGRGDGGNGNAGTWDVGHNGIWGQEIWDVGTGRNGGGGDAGRRHRPSPVLTPNPTTTAATEVPRPPLRTGRGQRQQCPHLSPGTFLGSPRFTFASRGAAAPLGRASPVGGGAASPGTKPGGPHTGGGPPGGGWPCVGGVLSPLMGGGERQRLQCHSPSTALPPFWVTSGRGHRSVTPKGGWGGAHPKIEPPSHSQREPPSPPRPLHSAEFPPLRGGTIWGWGT